MPINANNGVARVGFSYPAYIGTTGKKHRVEVKYPQTARLKMDEFHFEPGDSGTLIYDHLDPAWCTPLSPLLFSYWWEGKKVVMRQGLHRLKHEVHQSANCGYVVMDPQGLQGSSKVFMTGQGRMGNGPMFQVRLIDLLSYAEGKIDLLTLEALATRF